jgi:hypothetical protein
MSTVTPSYNNAHASNITKHSEQIPNTMFGKSDIAN